MTRNFLAEIIARKRERLRAMRQCAGHESLQVHALESRRHAMPHRFRRTLQQQSVQLKIIAEFKRKSPALGIICENASASEVAARYEKAGAAAVSVLTEEDYFGGSISDLAAARAGTSLPILRKDFIIDSMQIFEAAVAGADAVLLIAAALSDFSLNKFRCIAEENLDLDALVEVHTAGELRRAVASGATLIGVNNRDLNTFEVSVATSERLARAAPPGVILISESGLHDAQTLHRLHELGYAGFLIGEVLMRANDPGLALRTFSEAGNSQRWRQNESNRR